MQIPFCSYYKHPRSVNHHDRYWHRCTPLTLLEIATDTSRDYLHSSSEWQVMVSKSDPPANISSQMSHLRVILCLQSQREESRLLPRVYFPTWANFLLPGSWALGSLSSNLPSLAYPHSELWADWTEGIQPVDKFGSQSRK